MQGRPRGRGEHDDVVAAPAAALAVQGAADRQRRAPLDGDLLELPVGAREEGDPAPVRRPERELRALGPRVLGDPPVGDRPDVEEGGGVSRLGREGDARAVGREGHGPGTAAPQVEGRAGGRRDRRGDHLRRRAQADARRPTRATARTPDDRPRQPGRPAPARGLRCRAWAGASTGPPCSAIRASPIDCRRSCGSRTRQRRRRSPDVRRGRLREGGEVGLAGQHRREHVAHRLAVEEPAAGEHLVEHDAEGPDVGATIRRPAARLLRRHVGGGAEDEAGGGAGAGEGGRLREGRRAAGTGVVVPAPRLGEAEVEHLDLSVGRQLHVRRLEVAVDDALLVRLFERLGDLPGDDDGLVRRQRPALQPLGEVLALRQLHDQDVRLRPVVERHALEAVEVRDAGVVERGEDLRLALEAGEALGVVGEGLGQQLEGDLAAELRVGGAVHLAHPARAERREDLVASQATTGCQAQCARDSSSTGAGGAERLP